MKDYKHFHHQQGFLIPLALFIIVVLGGLAVMVAKQTAQSSHSFIVDAISTQTFYAAESGAQAGLHELFYVDTDRQLVDGRCATLTISQTLSADGLRQCVVTVSCTCRYENNTSCDHNNSANYLGLSGISHSFYTIDSTAQCGTGDTIARHAIEVGASL